MIGDRRVVRIFRLVACCIKRPLLFCTGRPVAVAIGGVLYIKNLLAGLIPILDMCFGIDELVGIDVALVGIELGFTAFAVVSIGIFRLGHPGIVEPCIFGVGNDSFFVVIYELRLFRAAPVVNRVIPRINGSHHLRSVGVKAIFLLERTDAFAVRFARPLNRADHIAFIIIIVRRNLNQHRIHIVCLYRISRAVSRHSGALRSTFGCRNNRRHVPLRLISKGCAINGRRLISLYRKSVVRYCKIRQSGVLRSNGECNTRKKYCYKQHSSKTTILFVVSTHNV